MDQMVLNFEGKKQDFAGTFQKRTRWENVKAGLKTWGIFWLFALLFVFVPYVNISVFMIFIPLGPVSMGIVYLVSKKVIREIRGEALCPSCNSLFQVSENNVRAPIYGNCPHCRCNFEIIVPS